MNRTTPTSINGEYHRNGETNYQDTDLLYNGENMFPDLLRSRIDSSQQDLDMGTIRKESYDRTRTAMAVNNHLNVFAIFIDVFSGCSVPFVHSCVNLYIRLAFSTCENCRKVITSVFPWYFYTRRSQLIINLR